VVRNPMPLELPVTTAILEFMGKNCSPKARSSY